MCVRLPGCEYLWCRGAEPHCTRAAVTLMCFETNTLSWDIFKELKEYLKGRGLVVTKDGRALLELSPRSSPWSISVYLGACSGSHQHLVASEERENLLGGLDGIFFDGRTDFLGTAALKKSRPPFCFRRSRYTSFSSGL